MPRKGYFQFKQFTVHQDQCAMKVTTDACVFGALIQHPNPNRVLDIGTGTGLLSLMLAQKTSSPIDAVELDHAASAQAKGNFENASWSDRLSIYQTKIQHYQPKHTYDLIVCNPPFFAHQLKSTDPKRRTAWHQTTLTHQDLSSAVQRLLSPQGKFWILLPPSELVRWEQAIKNSGLFVQHSIMHQSFRDSPPHVATLILGSELKTPSRQSLVYYSNPQKAYTEKALTLLEPYYLYL